MRRTSEHVVKGADTESIPHPRDLSASSQSLRTGKLYSGGKTEEDNKSAVI